MLRPVQDDPILRINEPFMNVHASPWLRILPGLLPVLLLASAAAGVEKLPPGAGRFEATHAGRQIPVWYYLPERAGPDAPVHFVMHGVNRDADRYRNEWQPHAEKYGFLLVVPEFSNEAFPGAESYNLGNTLDAEGRPVPREAWSFSYLEPIFDAAKLAAGNTSSHYSLYGHSAGAQFVHRFMYFVPEARVAKAVAANAGWWTLPDLDVDFPYGLRGSAVDEAALRTMLGKPLTVLLGTADTDPNHVNLRRTPEAMAQGPHRFARGKHFYESGRSRAASLNAHFGWQLSTAPHVDHNNQGMSVYAARLLFDPPTITSRDPDRVRVLFGGDTSCGESYMDQYVREGRTSALAEKGYDHGVVHLGRLLAAVDYRVINLETPLTLRRESPLTTKDYLHYSDPVQLPALFGKFGPTSFSLANNHTLDHGGAGLDDTRAALADAGIEWFGGDENLREAAKPLRQSFRVGDSTMTLALLGAFEYRTDYDRDFHFYAATDRPGTAAIDVAAVKQAVEDLKRTTPDAYVVYFVHWGGNYSWKNDEQTTAAKALREAGVDLVVGHGAHTMQQVEYDGRGWIFYSIGNFLFNAEGRFANYDVLPFGLPLVVEFSPGPKGLKTTLRAYPILSDNRRTGFQPRFATDDEMTEIEARLAKESGWNAATRAAVQRGTDDVGPFFEFGTP